MNIMNKRGPRLMRVSDLFLPVAFLLASLLGRGEAAFGLFVAFCATKIGSLATADGLRAAFATQPSMKYVQGSALVALIAQLPGAALALLALWFIPNTKVLLPLVPCGMLLNIEHVFYEYLCAVGDRNSASFSRCITAVLALLGLMLCMSPHRGPLTFVAVDPAWPLITCGLSALIGLFLSYALGGKCHPVPNGEVLRRAPLSMLQATLYPALAIAALALLWPGRFNPAPLFVGLMLYEACRTPFRRSPLESSGMNLLLLAVGGMATLCLVVFQFLVKIPQSGVISMTCAALLIAALCALALYGSIPRREQP
ncbi:MAG: hypothetical protein IKH49_03895 [Bacteroidales bacterium]|nr:hypothetical protein [Bacteroidales bacterium]